MTRKRSSVRKRGRGRGRARSGVLAVEEVEVMELKQGAMTTTVTLMVTAMRVVSVVLVAFGAGRV